MKHTYVKSFILAPGDQNEKAGGSTGAAATGELNDEQRELSRKQGGNQEPAPNSNQDSTVAMNNTLANRGSRPNRATLKTPPKRDEWAVKIMDVSPLRESAINQRTFRMVTFQPTNGTPIKVLPVNESFFDQNKDKFEVGNAVHLSVDNTEEGVTEYIDREGQTKFHTSTGQAVSNIILMSEDELDELDANAFAKWEGKPGVQSGLIALKAARIAAKYGSKK